MEESFAQVARTAALLVEIAAVFIVTYGALEAFAKLLWIIATPRTSHGARKALWRRFGMLDTQPGVIFLHYWGTGPADKLAAGFKAALDQLGKGKGSK